MNNEENSLKVKNGCYTISVGKHCPFCNAKNPGAVGDTIVQFRMTPKEIHIYDYLSLMSPTKQHKENEIFVEYMICPYCEKTSIFLYDHYHGRNVQVYPLANVKQFSNNVPENIYRDYTEAKSTLDLSPRASAALSRRCLQAMIHNRWNIDLGNLCNEINNIPPEKITQIERDALNAIRKIGNIGAHPDEIVDIDLQDAELMVSIIEIFLQKWYVDDIQLENLLNNAIETSKNKSRLKKQI